MNTLIAQIRPALKGGVNVYHGYSLGSLTYYAWFPDYDDACKILTAESPHVRIYG